MCPPTKLQSLNFPDAMQRDAMQRDAMQREAMQREAMQREAMTAVLLCLGSSLTAELVLESWGPRVGTAW